MMLTFKFCAFRLKRTFINRISSYTIDHDGRSLVTIDYLSLIVFYDATLTLYRDIRVRACVCTRNVNNLISHSQNDL